MGQLIIPHKDPGPPKPETPIAVEFFKETALTWADFHPKTGRPNPIPCRPDNATPRPQWRRVADAIKDLRARFINQNSKGIHPRCSSVDRSAVIMVYNEALMKLEHVSTIDAGKIHQEVKTKVSTILDLRKAAPGDTVFYTKGAFLSPLEPHYAQPRLDYYNRGNGAGDDSFYWKGTQRLREWRRGGWPKVYPQKAVEHEMRDRERMRGMEMNAVHKEGLMTALTADPLDWGDEIDADPERPWR